MFLSLVFLCSSKFITSINATFILGNGPHIPVLAILVSEWCPHCQELKPIFEELENLYDLDNRVSVARIICDHDNKICQQFEDTSTPSLYWVESIPEKAELYNGAITVNDIRSFIEKKLSPPIIHIQNLTQYNELLSFFEDNSIFVYKQSRNNNLSQIIQEISTNFSKFPCNFFELDELSDINFTHDFVNLYPKKNMTIYYEGNITQENIYNFVNSNAFPPFLYSSYNFLDHAHRNNFSILLLADEKPFFRNTLLDAVPNMPKALKSGVIFCGNNPKLCLQNLIPEGKGPHIVIMQPSKKYVWHFKEDLNVSKIINWANDVMDGKVRPAGTGAGFSGFLFELMDNAKRAGLIPFILIVSVLFVFMMTIIFGCISSVYESKRRRGYKKLQ